MITDRIGQQDVVLQINHNHYLKKTNTPRKNVSSRDNVFIKKFLHFGDSPVFLWIRGCCHGYFDHFCDLWISLVDLV